MCQNDTRKCQLLCSVHRVLDGTEYYDKTANGRKIKRWRHPDPKLEKVLYKAGWIKHPSTIWKWKVHLIIIGYIDI